jgi:uncharacterized metal-binding protein
MSKSPLSGAFAESSATTKKKSKKNGAILLIAGIALTSSIGGVFAANSITLNSNTAIEFGQGTAAVTSCEAALDASITQFWHNTDSVFRVNTVVVDGIAASCSGKTLKVSLLETDGDVVATYDIVGDGSATSDTEDLSGSNYDADTVARVIVTTED